MAKTGPRKAASRPSSGSNPTAGSAEPYWFEWKTGLLYLVELLDEDSEIVAVAFQLHGIKGWDDVGVRFSDGRTQLLQMKHSRIGDRLTFGDLVTQESEGSSSLIHALAVAWKSEKATRGTVECRLVTNRSAGPNWYQGRPPLEEFLDKVTTRVAHATSLDDVRWDGEDERYPGAWENFIAELNELKPEEKLEFLQALSIEVASPDLEALEAGIRDRLAALTGLPQASINGLFNALLANLRKWTCQTRRENEWIDREALSACLSNAESEPPWLGHCEVETPEPFFPSRNGVVDDLSASLLSESTHKVDFLSAEPGAGKTSCISKLARSGAVLWKEQCVSIRFYAYRPLRPGQPDMGSDFGIGVRPEALWLGLLWQIRDHLRKTHLLAELQVPVWLDEMPWNIARDHVLRIADALGSRWGRNFVVCIDGIDHAARAQRKHLPEFLHTLPSPDAIPAHVRFLFAGQPADAYPAEYPFFLLHAHAAVRVHPLGTLTDEDIHMLWRAAKPNLSVQAEDAVIRLLAEKGQRRTLSTVYAVEDIRTCATLEDASDVLNARPLADTLHNYYNAIWSAAVVAASDGLRLKAVFAMLLERPTGDLMASAFPDIGKSAAEWIDIMRRLRPLVRETAEGFEMLNNDLRVHLDASLETEPRARRDIASALANHYRKPESNRFFAHLSLFDLLTTAERRNDFAEDFTVDWVVEAGALGLTGERLDNECSMAFAAAVECKDWLLLHSVACGSLTVYRLNECLSYSDRKHDLFKPVTAPTFLPVEGEPLPFELWNTGVFTELVAACQQLVDCGASQRAAIVLKQWVGGISVEKLIEWLAISAKDENERMSGGDVLSPELERYGRLCALCGFPLVSTEVDAKKNSGFRAAVEIGWVRGLAELPKRLEALRYWFQYQPRYVVSWAASVEAAADHGRWGEVCALLNRMEGCANQFSVTERLKLGWNAARAKPKNKSIWQQPFGQPNYGLAEGKTSLTTLRMVASWITYNSPIREPTQVAEDLFPLLDRHGLESKKTSAVTLLLVASAIVGRLLRYIDRKDFKGAETAVPPSTLAPLLKALWCIEPDWRNLPHEEVQTPGKIGSDLAEIAWSCGTAYRQLLCDIAKERFSSAMSGDEGPRLFDILWECNERALLRNAVDSKAREVMEHLHEYDTSYRDVIISNLLVFARRLEMHEMVQQLTGRFQRTRIGYISSDEWVFQPLVRWYELVRKSSPRTWRSDGMQLLALDRICEQQDGSNNFSVDMLAELGAAAMECGPDDFEALFNHLATRDAKHPLWNLATASQYGFKMCVSEQPAMSEESIFARIAIAIALGLWPRESPLHTVCTILNAKGVPPDLAKQQAWTKAIRVAADIQRVPAEVEPAESSDECPVGPVESRSAEAILQEIIQPKESSWMRLRDIASLAEQARAENHPDRDTLLDTALKVLESSDFLSRSVEFHDIGLISRLYLSLEESERWRLIGGITIVTSEMRKRVHDPNWAFMVAFSAVDLACRARAADNNMDFGSSAFHQLLAMHWGWHGISASTFPIEISTKPSSWPDAARRILLSLMQTDACETFYMAMSGLRFFAEVFPGQIPNICRSGLAEEQSRDAIYGLAQLWATRHPNELEPALADFAANETSGVLDERLDSWIVGALFNIATGDRPRNFSLPSRDKFPEIVFPGDGPLLEVEAHMHGLMRHNSFANMANMRLRRVGNVLGSMDCAFRHMALAFREGRFEFPPMKLPPPKRLASDSSSPRQRHQADNIVGDSILYQCAGDTWRPNDAAAVRLLMGYGIDPWIASATPNIWPDKQSWPSDFDIERWIEAGSLQTADVGLRLKSLLEGHKLDPSILLLGAALQIPTYRRDLRFHFWLAAPNAKGKALGQGESMTPSGRTLAAWLTGWSFAASQPSDATTVHFVGNMVNYPNGELDITPTNIWTDRWGWNLDPKNNLCFRTADGNIVAWHERWLGQDASSNHVWRQPILSRWVARRDGFPPEFSELNSWTRRSEFAEGLLPSPE